MVRARPEKDHHMVQDANRDSQRAYHALAYIRFARNIRRERLL